MRTKEEIYNGCTNEEFQVKAIFDFSYFIERTFGTKLADFHREQLSATGLGRNICVISPRGHLKTTIFSVYFSLWKLYTEHKVHIMLVSSTIKQAQDIMSTIQGLIDENELLKDLVPTNRLDSWNKSEINTALGGKLQVLPFNDTIRGHHVNYAIWDDIIRESKLSQDECKKLFWSVGYPCTQTKKGKNIVVGTPLTSDDLLAELTGFDDDTNKPLHPEFVWKKYSAVITDSDGNWLKPLWEENFTLDELRNARSAMGPLAFDREYLCNPFAGSAGVFTREILTSQLHSDRKTTPDPSSLYFLGVDVAISKAIKADYSAFSVMEKRPDGIFYQVWTERYKGKTIADQIEVVRTLHRKFHFTTIVIEKRGLSEGMVKDMLDDAELRSFTIPFVTTHNTKEGLITRLQGALASKQLFVLDDDIQLKELQAFGIKEKPDSMGVKKICFESLSGHDDTVIALALSYEGASKLIGKFSMEVI